MELNSSQLHIYILCVTCFVGLCIGSFLNVVALRLLSDESFVFPPSKCPKCKNAIAWYDNIPVISYLLLRAKCRHCKSHISIQYPLVELSTALLFIAIVNSFGLSLKTLFLLILTSCLIVITITDLREKLIYDLTSIPLIPLGLIYNFFDLSNSGAGIVTIPLHGIGVTLTLNDVFISALIGAIVGGAFFEIFSRLGLLFVGQYAFGGGDSIIGAALGAWFGWKMVLIILALSFIFQLFIGLPIILFNMYKDKDHKSIIFTSILVFSVFIPYLGRMTGITNNLYGALFITLLAFTCAGIGVYVILKRTRERQSFTFIPFGPALVFGGFIVMFWGQKILSLCLNHYS